MSNATPQKTTLPDAGSVTPNSGDSSSNVWRMESKKLIISGRAAIIFSSTPINQRP